MLAIVPKFDAHIISKTPRGLTCTLGSYKLTYRWH